MGCPIPTTCNCWLRTVRLTTIGVAMKSRNYRASGPVRLLKLEDRCDLGVKNPRVEKRKGLPQQALALIGCGDRI
ncbi:hypothetical protein SBBP2_660013 [Burkholderiales bacterium]|nr:hypothetical protein SBBP2_660013 [Burkholderiales bacterium]